MNAPFKSKGKYVLFPIIALVFVMAAGGAVMLLWNAILPEVTGFMKPLSFMQAVGILVLSRILFGGFKGGGGPWKNGRKHQAPWKEKMMNMSEEEREKFRQEWKSRCGKE